MEINTGKIKSKAMQSSNHRRVKIIVDGKTIKQVVESAIWGSLYQ